MSGLTVFGAGLIPETIVPTLRMVGGGLLVAYGMYLFGKAGTATDEDGETIEKSGWTLFVSQFFIVFMAELGDKTQIATLAAAIENQAGLLVVFAASSTALVTVTSITVWGITKVPRRGVEKLQRAGAVLMVIYGIYMLI